MAKTTTREEQIKAFDGFLKQYGSVGLQDIGTLNREQFRSKYFPKMKRASGEGKYRRIFAGFEIIERKISPKTKKPISGKMGRGRGRKPNPWRKIIVQNNLNPLFPSEKIVKGSKNRFGYWESVNEDNIGIEIEYQGDDDNNNPIYVSFLNKDKFYAWLNDFFPKCEDLEKYATLSIEKTHHLLLQFKIIHVVKGATSNISLFYINLPSFDYHDKNQCNLIAKRIQVEMDKATADNKVEKYEVDYIELILEGARFSCYKHDKFLLDLTKLKQENEKLESLSYKGNWI